MEYRGMQRCFFYIRIRILIGLLFLRQLMQAQRSNQSGYEPLNRKEWPFLDGPTNASKHKLPALLGLFKTSSVCDSSVPWNPEKSYLMLHQPFFTIQMYFVLLTAMWFLFHFTSFLQTRCLGNNHFSIPPWNVADLTHWSAKVTKKSLQEPREGTIDGVNCPFIPATRKWLNAIFRVKKDRSENNYDREKNCMR